MALEDHKRGIDPGMSVEELKEHVRINRQELDYLETQMRQHGQFPPDQKYPPPLSPEQRNFMQNLLERYR